MTADEVWAWLDAPVEWTWAKQLSSWVRRSLTTSPEIERALHREVIHVYPDDEIVVDDGHWRAEFRPLGKDSRVFFGDVDISDHVYAMKVETSVRDLTRLTLEGYCLHKVEDDS
jgi:hypothetical protein